MSVSTTTALVSNINPSVFGQIVTFTATVTPSMPGVPTGNVGFFDGLTPLSTVPLVGGVAMLPISTLSVGMHQIAAVYGGDGTFALSLSNIVNQVVTPGSTVITISANSTTVLVGQPITFTSTITPVAPSTIPVTGSIFFVLNEDVPNPVLGSAPIINGVATFTTSALPVGTRPVVALYSGPGRNYPITLTFPLNVVVLPLSPVLTSNVNPSWYGQAVTFTVSVPAPLALGGTVTFIIDGKAVATVPLNAANMAKFTIATLAPGSHDVIAIYNVAGLSATSNLVVQKVMFCCFN
jgi:large repetitive protein